MSGSDDPAFISGVVRFDRPLLGDLSGLRGVHLQCYICTDTVSLSRLGARMTGLDFSPASIEQARDLVVRSGDDVSFVESDVYDAVSALGEIATALISEGLHIAGLVEHDSVPWEALPGQMTTDDRGEWRLTDRPWRMAASYTLQAVRSA